MNLVLTDNENKYYKRAILKEHQRGKDRVTAPASWPPSLDLHPLILRYRNEQIANLSSCGEFDWYDMIFAGYKTVNNALSLGTGQGRQEAKFQNINLVNNWCSIDLIQQESSLLKQESEFIQDDLNFIILPENKFQLILASGILHHIINLEHLLQEINKSLTEDGLLIVHEFIGAEKWQWQKELIRFINKEFIKCFYNYKNVIFNKHSLYEMNKRPLESIRSSEIPFIIDQLQFIKKYEIKRSPVLYPIMNTIRSHDIVKIFNDKEQLDEILRWAIDLDKKVLKEKMFNPTELIGIYGKSASPKRLVVKKWANRKTRKLLCSKMIPSNVIVNKIKYLSKKILNVFIEIIFSVL